MSTPTEPPVRIRWYALVLLLAHLGLLVIGAYALWDMGGGWWIGAAAAAGFVIVYGTWWALWMAQGGPRRLAYRERLIALLISGTIVVVLAGFAGVWLSALVAASVAVLCDTLNER